MSAKGERGSVARGTAEGLQLPSGYTASGFLHELLRGSLERWPDVLGSAAFPADASTFRSSFGEAMVRFEAARAASPLRTEIASDLVRTASDRLCFLSNGKTLAHSEYWSRSAEPLAFETIPAVNSTALTPHVDWEGRRYSGKDLHELADSFLAGSLMTRPAADALRWIADQHGGIDLSGRKFVVLGAGAELAATSLLLEAGASVLWIDVTEPQPLLEDDGRRAGVLTYVANGADLLRQAREIVETITRFAGDDPVHLGLYAYAAGGGREWRLAAAMNSVVRHLDPQAVRLVALLVSPTSPAVVQPEDLEAAQRRRPRWWQALLERAGIFPPGRFAVGSIEIARAIVSLQGASYQAAQYIEKILTAESLAAYGTGLDATRRAPVTVSANVAGISRTRSLSHPVFDEAFIGAPLLGVTTFAPETTRSLSGLLALHDLLNPQAPGSASQVYADDAARAAALFSQQVHGGIYALPWALDPCITAAAVIGLARRPSLLWRVIRGAR